MVCDINGLELTKGDVVAPVSGDMKGKVCGLKTEDGEGFVCIRAAHRPYSKGVWYAAEHVQRLAIGKVRPRSGKAAAGNGKAHADDLQPAAATADAERPSAQNGRQTRPASRSRTAEEGRSAPAKAAASARGNGKKAGNGATKSTSKRATTSAKSSGSSSKRGATRAIASN